MAKSIGKAEDVLKVLEKAMGVTDSTTGQEMADMWVKRYPSVSFLPHPTQDTIEIFVDEGEDLGQWVQDRLMYG